MLYVSGQLSGCSVILLCPPPESSFNAVTVKFTVNAKSNQHYTNYRLLHNFDLAIHIIT